MTVNLNASLIWIIIGGFLALSAGTVVRMRGLKHAAGDEVKSRLQSLRSWWIISGAVALAVLLGQLGVTLLMAAVGWLAFREFLQLVPPLRSEDRYATAVTYVLLPAHFALIYFGWTSQAAGFLPLALLLLTGTVLVLGSGIQGFLRSASMLCWGGMLTVYTLSHAAMLTTATTLREPALGSVGYFLFVIILTELNDISQALVGRRVGRRKITPIVSPKKTWEGLLGGLTVSCLAAMPLGHWLLPSSSIFVYLALGATLAVIGFYGDIHMSAFKRDLGVKDSGNLIPGQGGILDRIDSLTFTAPAFFYLATWLFPV